MHGEAAQVHEQDPTPHRQLQQRELRNVCTAAEVLDKANLPKNPPTFHPGSANGVC